MAVRQITQSFTMNGTDAFVLTSQPLGFRPISFTIAGTPTAVLDLDNDPISPSSWYWRYQSNAIVQGGVIAPAASTVISVTYEPFVSNAVTASVPASIAELADINTTPYPPSSVYDYTPQGGSGIYSTGYDTLGTTTADQASAIAAGVQRRASVTPRAFTFQTDEPGWRIGQTLTINHVGFDLLGVDFIVVSISGKPSEVSRGRGSFMEYTIESVILEDAPDQSPADPNPPTKVITNAYPITPTQPLERLRALTQQQPPTPQYKEWQVVLGSGGDLVAATPLGNRCFVLLSQTIIEVYALPSLTKPPVDQDLEIDIFLNGVSIFDNPFAIPAGTTTPLTMPLRDAPTALRAQRGDIVTFGIEYTNIGADPEAAQDLTIQFLGKIL